MRSLINKLIICVRILIARNVVYGVQNPQGEFRIGAMCGKSLKGNMSEAAKAHILARLSERLAAHYQSKWKVIQKENNQCK